MGRAAKLRKQRQTERLFTDAYRLEAQEAKKPCAGCAFADPEAWVADTAMAQKIVHCLSKPQQHHFYCHEGMPKGGEEGIEYLPPLTPDGQPDTSQLTPCGGFLRWAVKYRLASFFEQFRAVMALQLHMCTRFLQGDFEYAAELRVSYQGRADILQKALNAATLHALPEDYD